MRRTAFALILALGGLLTVGAAVGQAWHLGGKKWPTRTITYHASAPQYKDAIRTAVEQWNTSGVNIRFKAVKRSRAKLQIVYGTRGGPSGRATLGWRPVQTHRTLDGARLIGDQVPCGARVGTSRVRCERYGPRVWLDRVAKQSLKDPLIRHQMVLVVVHELGHSLGLNHHHARCAVMSYRRDEICPKPPLPWQSRCRLIERDDLNGVLRRYGGKAKPLAPEFCELYVPPAAPTALAATYDAADESIEASWINAASPDLAGTVVTFKLGSCLVADAGAPYTPGAPGSPGWVSFDGPQPGGYCVTAWSRETSGHIGPSVSTWVDVPAPAPD